MKLNEEIRERIDKYFNNVSADELYELLVNKYGFTDTFTISKEDSNLLFYHSEEIDITNSTIDYNMMVSETLKRDKQEYKSNYQSNYTSTFDDDDNSSLALVA
jgi:hypothetical protein